MSSLGSGVRDILDAFGLSAQEEKVVATIRMRFVKHFTPDTNISLEFVQDATIGIGKPEI
jgi:hypothetical protein